VTRSDQERLADLFEAADDVALSVAVGHDAWLTSRLHQLAAERGLEIVGEAARAMSDAFRASHPDVPWTKVIGLRTRLAHHYHRIDPEMVWVIATVELPGLVEVLRR
jgi:uncharacterized protein with HEPN domain